MGAGPLLATQYIDFRALRHSFRGAGDRVGHVVILDRRTEWRRVERSFAPETAPGCRLDGIEPGEMRELGEERAPQLAKRVVGQRTANPVGERADNFPILARLAERKYSRNRLLHAAFGIEVDTVFLGIGRSRQNYVGAVRTGVAVMPLIDHEGFAQALHRQLVRTEQVDEIYLARFCAGKNARKVAS